MLHLLLALLLLLPASAWGQQAPTPPQGRTVLAGNGKDGVVTWANAARLAPLHVRGAYRVIDGKAENVTVDGLTADNLVRGGARLRAGSHDVVIRHFRLVHQDAPNVSPDLPEGIDIQGCTHCTFEHGYLSGFRMTGLKYPNGDGLNVEKPDYDLTFRDILSENQSDSAFDWLKGHMLRGYDLTGRYSARCIKAGAADAYIETLTCVGNRTAIEFHGGDLHIGTLNIDNTSRTTRTWLLSLSAGSGANRVQIDACTVKGPLKPTQDSIVIGKGPGVTLVLGPTCKLR